MILIADSGSTKCDWVLVENDGTQICEAQSTGLNPLILNENELEETILKIDLLIEKKTLVDKIYFYGAGCGEIEAKNRIRKVLTNIFKYAGVTVEEDTFAAVRACTNQPAVVCILGTGSNCSFFNGTGIIQKIPALGYLLADEGSGNYFGKRLLKDFYEKTMPENLTRKFKKEYPQNLNTVLEELYGNKYPNKYLADYALFLFKNRGDDYVENLLHEGIEKYVFTFLHKYHEEASIYPIHFVGSVAYHAQDIIIKIVRELGYEIRSFVKKPINGMVVNIVNEKREQVNQ
ncbi:N-acetylglucosamine kinase [Abyssalbus ytuae]|uniref:N-acetylglucosamine kinase n=1 Tax=Abyssalbus ytuae TaxID=2926907 RepID=A0A9E6ZQA2_9FLAO|nr:N-acetylglucosamine kinase [Abyssalbus ytuae]UOB16803.1 N-acetylglucosamine kinase [Abyssalbus ytuae]